MCCDFRGNLVFQYRFEVFSTLDCKFEALTCCSKLFFLRIFFLDFSNKQYISIVRFKLFKINFTSLRQLTSTTSSSRSPLSHAIHRSQGKRVDFPVWTSLTVMPIRYLQFEGLFLQIELIKKVVLKTSRWILFWTFERKFQ